MTIDDILAIQTIEDAQTMGWMRYEYDPAAICDECDEKGHQIRDDVGYGDVQFEPRRWYFKCNPLNGEFFVSFKFQIFFALTGTCTVALSDIAGIRLGGHERLFMMEQNSSYKVIRRRVGYIFPD